MPAPAMAAALDPAVARGDPSIARPRPAGARMTRRVLAAAAAALLLACIAMSLIEGDAASCRASPLDLWCCFTPSAVSCWSQ
jgi:hypothetical protein